MEVSVLQADLPIGDAAEARIVRGHDHRRIVLPHGPPEKLAHGLRRIGIQLRSRLVGQQHVGRADQAAGDGDPLLFAAAEVAGELFGLGSDAQLVEHLKNPLALDRLPPQCWASATLS